MDQPQGKGTREIRKQSCQECLGTGVHKKESRVKCPSCKGQGWMEDKSGAEVVCLQCNGDGTVLKVTETECQSCSGKGYLVRIVEVSPPILRGCTHCSPPQITDEWVVCGVCGGKGEVATNSKSHTTCWYCKGRRLINKSNYCKHCHGFWYVTEQSVIDVTPGTGKRKSLETPPIDPPLRAEMIRQMEEDSVGDDVLKRISVAIHSLCPEDILWSLAYDDEDSVVYCVANNPNCPPDLFQELIYHHGLEGNDPVLTAICRNPSCPPDLLAELAWYWGDTAALHFALANPSFQRKLLEELIREKSQSPETEERINALCHSECPADVFEELASDFSVDVRSTIAESNWAPPQTLAKLCVSDPDPDIRYAAKENPNNPLTHQASNETLFNLAKIGDTAINIKLASHDDCSEELLMLLADDHHPEVRQVITERSDCPVEILAKLAKDQHESVLLRVAKHPNTPPEALEFLCASSSGWVRAAIAENPSTSAAALRKLADSEFFEYRELVARSRNCPVDLLQTLASDKENRVRAAAWKNPNYPGEV